MAINRLAHKVVSSLLFANMVSGYKRRASVVKIKAAQAYIVGVKKTRLLSVGILFVLFSLALFVSGLWLIQAALFTYSMWSPQVKFGAALVLGVLELGGALSILIYLFKEDTWIKFAEIDKLISAVVDDKDDQQGEGYETKTSQKERT